MLRSRLGRTVMVSLTAIVIAITQLAPTASAAPALIKGLDTRWSPASVAIAKGGTVRWKSVSSLHNVYSYGSNWSIARTIPEGDATKYRFRKRGTFRFRCTLHSSLLYGECSGMCGSVRVS